ncbi:MAG: DUF1266 domain-containing protein [Tannerella sp.]|jgi:hypothetical protein|nr:DUF1266 domain-containing protein [Tannerella sp.]
MELSEYGRLLFEIKGKPKWYRLKRHRSHVSVYAGGIRIEMWGNDDACAHRDIYDVYIKEPAIEGVDSRTTSIDFYREGAQYSFDLEDDTFPGFSEQMERALENEWSFILEKRACPPTLKWFMACTAINSIECESNPCIFGFVEPEPEEASAQRLELYEDWGVNNRLDLLGMLPDLLDGCDVKQYAENLNDREVPDVDERALLEQIEREGGARCIWAWDLQRLILLCELGYVSDYLTLEEAWDWSLAAGQKLQGLYGSWDEFMRCYLLGDCFQYGESPEDESSQAYSRRYIYEYYKKRPNSPWNVKWDLPLAKE